MGKTISSKYFDGTIKKDYVCLHLQPCYCVNLEDLIGDLYKAYSEGDFDAMPRKAEKQIKQELSQIVNGINQNPGLHLSPGTKDFIQRLKSQLQEKEKGILGYFLEALELSYNAKFRLKLFYFLCWIYALDEKYPSPSMKGIFQEIVDILDKPKKLAKAIMFH